MHRKYRNPDEIDLWLHPNLGDNPRNAREAAIVEMLCRIPDLDYWTLTKRLMRYAWFAPDANAPTMFTAFDALGEISMQVDEMEGSVGKITHVIYLCPRLDTESSDLLHCLVADKLAHLLLDHDTMLPEPDEIATVQREERFRKLCQWGMEAEITACRTRMAEWARIE